MFIIYMKFAWGEVVGVNVNCLTIFCHQLVLFVKLKLTWCNDCSLIKQAGRLLDIATSEKMDLDLAPKQEDESK